MSNVITPEAELLWRTGATITPAAQLWGRTRLATNEQVMATPSGFLFDSHGIMIRRAGYGKFITDFDHTSEIVSGTAYYIDPVSGNDANSGLTPLLKKQNISSAVTAANTAGGPAIFYLTKGIYTITRTFYGTIPKVDFSMICPDGIAKLVCGSYANA